MFEYKVGDEVRCKKFFKDKNRYTQFYEGSIYKITHVYQLYDIETSVKHTFAASKSVQVENYTFKEEDFYIYFYSKKEIRQMKLDKIDKNK